MTDTPNTTKTFDDWQTAVANGATVLGLDAWREQTNLLNAPEREYSFTTSATFTAPSLAEAWDEYYEWLTDASNVGGGTEVVTLPAVDYTDFANAPKFAHSPEYTAFTEGGTFYLEDEDNATPWRPGDED